MGLLHTPSSSDCQPEICFFGMRAPERTKAFFEDFLTDEIWFGDVVALGEVGWVCRVEFWVVLGESG